MPNKVILQVAIVLLLVGPVSNVVAQHAAAVSISNMLPDSFDRVDTIVMEGDNIVFLPFFFRNLGELDLTGANWEYQMDETSDYWKKMDQKTLKLSEISPGEHILRFRHKNVDKQDYIVNIILINSGSFFRQPWLWIVLAGIAMALSGRLYFSNYRRYPDFKQSALQDEQLQLPVAPSSEMMTDEMYKLSSGGGLSEKDTEWLSDLNKIIAGTMNQYEIRGEYLASQMYISRSRLFHKIKHLTGMSLSQYVMEQRLRKAHFLLEQKKCPTVKAVALSVGLKHVNYFSKKYKERFGNLPSTYF